MDKSLLMRSPAWIQPKPDHHIVSLFDKYGKTVKMNKNTILAHENDSMEYIYYLTSGLCRHTFSLLGEKTSTVSLILPGRCIGDIFAVQSSHIFLRLEVIDRSTFKIIPKSMLLKELEADSKFAIRVIKYFSDKHHSYLEGMICNAVLTPEERLQILFNTLSKDSGSNILDGYKKIEIKMTQQLISEITNTSRVTVNLTLNRWLQNRTIIRKDSHIWVNVNYFDKMLSS